MTTLISREHYRDLLVWSLMESDGLSEEEALRLANVNLDQNIAELQAQEDRRLLEILESMSPEVASRHGN